MIKETKYFDGIAKTFETQSVSSKSISASINFLDDVLQEQKRCSKQNGKSN